MCSENNSLWISSCIPVWTEGYAPLNNKVMLDGHKFNGKNVRKTNSTSWDYICTSEDMKRWSTIKTIHATYLLTK